MLEAAWSVLSWLWWAVTGLLKVLNAVVGLVILQTNLTVRQTERRGEQRLCGSSLE